MISIPYYTDADFHAARIIAEASGAFYDAFEAGENDYDVPTIEIHGDGGVNETIKKLIRNPVMSVPAPASMYWQPEGFVYDEVATNNRIALFKAYGIRDYMTDV